MSCVHLPIESTQGLFLCDCDEMKEGNIALCGLHDISLLSFEELKPQCIHASVIQALHDKGALRYLSHDHEEEARNLSMLAFKPLSPITVLSSGRQLSWSCDFTSEGEPFSESSTNRRCVFTLVLQSICPHLICACRVLIRTDRAKHFLCGHCRSAKYQCCHIKYLQPKTLLT